MGYFKNTIKGVAWMGMLQASYRLLTFIKIIIIARILTPNDFGLFGIAALFLSFLEIIGETGVNTILIQAKSINNEYLNSAWVVSIIRGLGICVIMVALAPIIALFFNAQNAINLILLMSLVPLIRGFLNPSIIYFQKALKFKYEFLLRLTVVITDAIIAILITIIFKNTYGLIFGLISGASVELILSFILFKQKPKFILVREYLSEIYKKGKWITGYSIMNYLSENTDNIVVGRLLGISQLGAYQMAYRVSSLPTTEGFEVLNKVLFPVLTNLKTNKLRLLKAFLKSYFLTVFLTTIFGLIIFVYSQQIIEMILGTKWLIATDVLKILAIFLIFKGFSTPAITFFLSTDNQKYLSFVYIVKFITLALLIVPFVLFLGLIGAAIAQLLSAVIILPLTFYLIFKSYNKI